MFSVFHTKEHEIVAADCLGLYSDRKWIKAAGLMIRSVQTDTGNSKQISHRGMWVVCERKNLCFAWQIPVILQSVLTSSFLADDLP